MRTHTGWVAAGVGLGLAVVSCKAKRDPSATVPLTVPALQVETPVNVAPPTLTRDVAVLFERVLPTHHNGAPVFGPDQRVSIGPRRWSRDGTYLGLHRWAQNGQMMVVADTGSAAAPLLLVHAIPDVDLPTPRPKVPHNESLVLSVEPDATVPTRVVATAANYEPGGKGLSLSPDGTRYSTVEGTNVVVRGLDGAVVASVPIGVAGIVRERIICWRDNNSIAWIDGELHKPMLRALPLVSAPAPLVPVSVALPTLLQNEDVEIGSCDPGGGAAIVVDKGAVLVLDLVSAAASVVAKVDEANADTVAVGGHGQRAAISVGDDVTLYQRAGSEWASLWHHHWPAGARSDALFYRFSLTFSGDGNRLAIAGGTLVVVGPAADVVAPAPPSTFDFTLPKTFNEFAPRQAAADDDGDDSHWYGQLPTVSGLSPFPHLLLHAFREEPSHVDVVALSLDANEFAGHVPMAAASDADLATFAKYLMPRLFDHWNGYVMIDTAGAAIAALPTTTEREPGYSLKVGRTDGKPWFETRELQRDGCENYDGYTKVVIDGHEIFVVRALTYPGGPIQGWLDKFFDLPFGVKVQIARRKGPTMGPC